MTNFTINEVAELSSYGSQNKIIIDRLDEFKEQENTLLSSLKFIETVKYSFLEKNSVYSGNSGNSTLSVSMDLKYFLENKKCLFMRNIRITNLNADDYEVVCIEVGGQRIDSIYNFLYPILIKELSDNFDNSLINDNNTIVPFKLLGLPYYNSVKFIIKLSRQYIKLDGIFLMFDLFELPNQDPITFRSEHIFETIQYNGKKDMNIKTLSNIKHINKMIKLNLANLNNLVGFKIDNGIVPKNIKLFLSSEMFTGELNLVLSYVLDNIYIFKFEKIINFGTIDYTSLVFEIEDTRTDKNVDIFVVQPFCFNINLIRQMSGMTGLALKN